jgi:RimJ/RimL family protein N-acetyltransferase
MSSTVLPATIQAYGMTLRRLQHDDIERVRQWRNHPEVARHMLSQVPISREQQAAWFARVHQAEDRAYYLAYYQNEPTAFASVTSENGLPLTDSEQLEAAIYLAPDSRCRGNLLAFAPALALNDACFDMLHCQRLVAKIKQENEIALRFNVQMGYEEFARDNALIYLVLKRDNYISATQQLKAMLGRTKTTGQQQSELTT